MEHVNDIINNICEKLGTTVEFLIPEYTKMKIATAWSYIVVMLIICAIYVFAIVVYRRLEDRIDAIDLDVIAFALFFGGLVIFTVLVFILVMYIPTIIRYSVSPIGAFFDDVIRQIM